MKKTAAFDTVAMTVNQTLKSAKPNNKIVISKLKHVHPFDGI